MPASTSHVEHSAGAAGPAFAPENKAGLIGIAPASARDRRDAFWVSVLLLAAFAATAPFARLPARALPGFVPTYDAALMILDLITAVLLYTQYRELRLRSLLALTCAYAYTPLLVAAHALSFPDAFQPGHLIGGVQTTAWLWMGWHAVFPLFVCAYALQAHAERRPGGAVALSYHSRRALATTLALAGAIIVVTVAGEVMLPQLMLGNRYQSVTTKWILAAGWMVNGLALFLMLGLTRTQRVIDLWITVAMLASLIDLGLSAVMVDARYQLGFYLGRAYGLLAASCVLVLLLRETFRLQAGAARAWNALQASEARFRALAEASPALIWQVDAEGRAVYFNQRCLEVTGLPRAALAGSGWRAVVSDEDLPEYEALLARAQREQLPLQRRLRVRTRDGQWRWFDCHAAPWFGEGGDYLGHVGISIDVSDSVEAENALREAGRRKDEFLATLAHELRNPLAPISNALSLLKLSGTGGRRLGDGVIDMMDRQVAHMVRLVDDLLEIARITNGKIELIRRRLDLAEAVRGAIETCAPQLQAKQHVLTLETDRDPVWVDADPVRLIQVVSNLLNNAARYTADGGRITVQAGARDGQAIVLVRDNGAGIPADMLERVFEMFRQLPGQPRASQQGLGIGLSMAQRLVQLHGGTIEAKSEGPGKGSEFIVRLPLAERAPSAPPDETVADPHAARRLNGCSVLVVDDNRDAANSLAVLLQAEGAEVHVAHDGSSALAELGSYHPQAVFLDIGLPDISGYEVAQRIRRRRELDDVRLVALSGWGQERDRARSHDCGFNAHVTKPVNLATLQSLLAAR